MAESKIPVYQPVQALRSMRQAPYTTESALAELIDNSLQADAENIAILAKDELREDSSGRSISRLKKIAVFDDGHGMDKDLLQNCLSVGFSRNKEDLEGLGKFGFGMLIELYLNVTEWKSIAGKVGEIYFIHTLIFLN